MMTYLRMTPPFHMPGSPVWLAPVLHLPRVIERVPGDSPGRVAGGPALLEVHTGRAACWPGRRRPRRAVLHRSVPRSGVVPVDALGDAGGLPAALDLHGEVHHHLHGVDPGV